MKLLEKFRHDNIVSLIKVNDEPKKENNYHFHMELALCTLVEISKYWTKGNELKFLLNYGLVGICEAIELIHEKQYIHFDIKPLNILFFRSPSNILKLCDFGSCVHLSLLQDPNSDFEILSTPVITAPEILFKPEAELNSKVDVFAFGMTLWQTFMKKVPFAGLNSHQVLKAIANENFPPTEDLPTNIQVLVQHCWNRDPINRPSFQDIKCSLLQEGANLG